MTLDEILESLLENYSVGTDIYSTPVAAMRAALEAGKKPNTPIPHITHIASGASVPPTPDGMKRLSAAATHHDLATKASEKRAGVAAETARLQPATDELRSSQSYADHQTALQRDAYHAEKTAKLASIAKASVRQPGRVSQAPATKHVGLLGKVFGKKDPQQNSGFESYSNLLEEIVDSFIEDTMSGQIASYAMPFKSLVGSVQDGVQSFDDNFVNTPKEIKKRKKKRGHKDDRLGQVATAMALAVGT